MLNRQKIILQMAISAGRPVSRLELVKWAFLLRHEFQLGDEAAFYDFLPYQYGPFSFTLYHETAALVRDGLLSEPDDQHWAATAGSADTLRGLPAEYAEKARSTVSRVSGMTQNELVEHVYARYPWYAMNSKLKQRPAEAKRPIASSRIYTAGYEGASIDAFINRLLMLGIRRLVDVRKNPIARRYGFHKSTLQRLCGHAGLEYKHMPELGIPSEWRRDLASRQDYDRLFTRYETEIMPENMGTIRPLAMTFGETPTALVCMEADADFCHRARLARAVSALNQLEIAHL